MLLGFGIDAWITIVTVLGMFTVLLTTKLRTDLVFLGAIGLLCVTGVLDAKEAFSGFSSTSVVVIGVMSLINCALIAAAAMLVCRCCTPDQAMKSINWDILIVFAASVVLGLASRRRASPSA